MIDDGVLNPTDLDVIDPNIQQNVPVPIPVIPYNQGFDPLDPLGGGGYNNI